MEEKVTRDEVSVDTALDRARRGFLQKAGKLALLTPPMFLALMYTSNPAVAGGGRGGTWGGGSGKGFAGDSAWRGGGGKRGGTGREWSGGSGKGSGGDGKQGGKGAEGSGGDGKQGGKGAKEIRGEGEGGGGKGGDGYRRGQISLIVPITLFRH